MQVAPLVTLEHVSFAYGGAPVLEDISLTVDPGDFLGLIGPNGSGKTTLARIMLGLLVPTAGRVTLFGARPEAFRAWHRVGYVPQRLAFDIGLPITAGEVVATGMVAVPGRWRWRRHETRGRIREALALVGMEAHLTARVGTLSIGQQQRVLIARALVARPDLLVLDEPTGGVDPEAQRGFYAFLQHLNHDRAVTLVLISHDIGVVATQVTKLACLNRRLVFHGPPGDFLRADGAITALYGPAVTIVTHEHG